MKKQAKKAEISSKNYYYHFFFEKHITKIQDNKKLVTLDYLHSIRIEIVPRFPFAQQLLHL